MAAQTATTDQVRSDWEFTERRRIRERQIEREKCSILERLIKALEELGPQSVVPAAPMGPRVGVSAERDQAPRDMGSPSDIVRRELDTIHRSTLAIEEIVDRERGLIHQSYVRDRDQEVWEDWQGYSAAQVADAAPHLGTTAKTIRRAREREADRRRVKVDVATGVVIRPMNSEELGMLVAQGSAGVE